MRRGLGVVCVAISLACDVSRPPPQAIFIPTPTDPPPAPLTANLVDGPLSVRAVPDGFEVSGLVTNRGQVCATRVSGHLAFTSATAEYVLTWTLPAAHRIRPGESASYAACCLPRATSGMDVAYRHFISQDSVPCG